MERRKEERKGEGGVGGWRSVCMQADVASIRALHEAGR